MSTQPISNPPLRAKLERNLRLLRWFRIVEGAGVVIPVIVPFFQSGGLSELQIFWLQAVFSLAMLACEVPTGRMADHYGRRICLLFGSCVVVLGFGL